MQINAKISYIEIGGLVEISLYVGWLFGAKSVRVTTDCLQFAFRAYIHINVTIFHYLIHMEISKQLVKIPPRR